jgi:competence protein ComEC
MSKSNFFVLVLVSFIAGISVSSFFEINLFYIFCVGLADLFLLIVLFNSPKWRIFFLVLLFFVIGFGRFQISLPGISDQSNIYYYNGQTVELTAIVKKVDTRQSHQKLTVMVSELYDISDSVSGLVLVNSFLYPEYRVGDRVDIKCQLNAPQAFEDFAYDKYLARYNIYTVCNFANIQLIDKGQASLLDGIKSQLESSLNRSIAEPHVSVLQALVIGNRRGIPESVLDDVSSAGLSHIIAISGMHIAIIVMVIMYLSIFFGLIREKAFWVALVFIVFYIAMIGFPASAARGAIMALLVLYAGVIGRLNYSINAILFAAAVMLMVNPKLLLYDIGFQLSFMAVLGIMYLMPILKNKFASWPGSRSLKNIIIVTLSAQIMTLPLIVYYFHNFSVLSVVSNILVLPILPFVMLWTILVAVLGMFFPLLGQWLGYISYLIVDYILAVARLISNINVLSIEFKIDSFYLVIISYVVIFLFIRKYFNKEVY